MQTVLQRDFNQYYRTYWSKTEAVTNGEEIVFDPWLSEKEERVSVGDCHQMYGQESGVNQQLNVEESKKPMYQWKTTRTI